MCITTSRKALNTFMAIPFLFLSVLALPSKAEFKDPLDIPAVEQKNSLNKPFIGSSQKGRLSVIVGPAGLILASSDAGQSWKQAQVPVQSDLVAVTLVSESKGWAVGHDGVILVTADGGASWQKQLDGVMAAEQFKKYYENMLKKGEPEAELALEATELNYRDGPALPYLDVWFKNESVGFAVGAFGNIARTDDGGDTWAPWTHRIDNESGLHLNSVTAVGGGIFIGSERGTIFRLNEETNIFEIIDTGYSGSFTGITGDDSQVIAYGLQGTAYRSTDSGANWQVVAGLPRSTINNAFLRAEGKGFVLVSQAGELVLTDHYFSSFDVLNSEKTTIYTSVVEAADNEFLVTTLEGVERISLSERKTEKPRTQE
ncbi:WD40/YVTN/BNR-like repeat-containing protein [Halopseudomonas xiamenensis]|uniref:WD40/YVTN/BNR-like repeat-containing protein n=1 Tax=Halopseudomonas xiamenensis TaxID=157792 RepID=UPI0016269FAA|nr:YCF48-related protein [Halopseudomonas xiamenensis]